MNSKITGIVCCLPPIRVKNDAFTSRFDEKAISDVAKMTGVATRFWTEEHQTTADLCIEAARRLEVGMETTLADCDAIIFVTQTPDHILPGSSFVAHRDLGLPTACTCLDLNAGCSGYVLGLSLAQDLIAAGSYKKILLLAGDTISKTLSPTDRATAMVFGDAGTATLVEASSIAERSEFKIGVDSRGVESLKIEAGQFRKPKTADDDRDNYLFMDGAEVFNFTLKSIPSLVKSLGDVESFDYVFMHQANAFMLKHIAKRAKLTPAQVPINIEKFGNTSSATIPLLMCDIAKSDLLSDPQNCALLGFGVGFSWAACAMKIGPLKHLEVAYL
jgi:3-oxoacyl-[acyl-carrier-protein] synthase-3